MQPADEPDAGSSNAGQVAPRGAAHTGAARTEAGDPEEAHTEAGDPDAPRAVVAEHPIKIRELEVLRTASVTPLMLRVVLGGENVVGFESHCSDEHVKLVFPDPETGQTRAPEQAGDRLAWPRPFPPTREYTIRHYDAEAGEVTIDFVLHSGGLAAGWAEDARPGDRLWVAGPRPGYLVPDAFTYRVILGDHTALPAVARILEEMPAKARARVAVLIPDASERQDLAVREGVDVTWLRLDDPDRSQHDFGAFLAETTLPEEEHTYFWAAGEASLLKPARAWAKQRGFARGNGDISGYWRRGRNSGVTEGQLRVARLKHRAMHLFGIDHDD